MSEEAKLKIANAIDVEQKLRKHAEGFSTALKAVIWMHVDGDVIYTQGALSRLLAVTTGNTTRVIDQMMKAGWASSVVDSTDRRRKLISLTDTGIHKALMFVADLERSR